MQGFTIRSHDSVTDMDAHVVYRDGGGPAQDVYTVVLEGEHQKPSLQVEINAESIGVCEVQVFGEPSCEQGRWGWYCEQTCNCAGGEVCLPHSGGCPTGCASGFSGADCRTKIGQVNLDKILSGSCRSSRDPMLKFDLK
ncbi:calcium binding EGF domain protein [Elysia marginata]|uniref:Calcium binding EGF domain protein n=1 Tax=Elysia marginata TaxID=1093978 RepID=A0AAV4JK75_9GAST|nr:calcium binding EGF domain protein [Elysia marginata]